MRRTSHNQDGLSLLELLIALGIFMTVSAGISDVLTATSDTYQTGLAISVLESKGRRALDRMAINVVGSGVGTFVPNPELPFGSTTLSFQPCAGYDRANSVADWGTITRYELRDEEGDAEDGADNDGDGLIDERELVQIRGIGIGGGVETVICTGITRYLEGEIPNGLDDNDNGLIDEEGLVFSLRGKRLRIQITVAGRGAEGLMLERTISTAVVVRN